MNNVSFVNLAYFYVLILVGFSICLVMVGGEADRRPTLLWLVSNILAGSAMLMFVRDDLVLNSDLRPFLVLPQNFALACKFLALSDRWKLRGRRQLALALFVMPALLVIVLTSSPLYQLRSFAVSVCGILTCLACLFATGANRYWYGSIGRKAMLINWMLCILGLMWRASESWPLGVSVTFFGSGEQRILSLSFLGILSFLSQMAFLLMLSGRAQRDAMLKNRRAERIHSRSVSLRLQNKEISRLLDEQRRMLTTLTHEVRQPINNAQAALQGIMSDLQPKDAKQKRVLPIAIRVQGILDGITLALSNAIIGATLVERGERSQLRDCEIISIAQLALHDCPTNAQERISCNFPSNDIFLAADPILLRLAFRNLLDNAAKFSPPGTEIVFSIRLDEARFGVLISVTNTVSSSFMFERDMINRGKRGHDHDIAGQEGSGIGLHIVNEVARIHGQAMVVENSEPGKMTFGLLLSE